MRDPFIQLRDVHKSFGPLTVLAGVNLSVYEGEVTTIIGKSGGGKSVLLKHIIGLISPDSGEILFEGSQLGAMNKTERKRLKTRFSYMFQNMALFDSINAVVYIIIRFKIPPSIRLRSSILVLNFPEISASGTSY